MCLLSLELVRLPSRFIVPERTEPVPAGAVPRRTLAMRPYAAGGG